VIVAPVRRVSRAKKSWKEKKIEQTEDGYT
jgi:hypothetical protein